MPFCSTAQKTLQLREAQSLGPGHTAGRWREHPFPFHAGSSIGRDLQRFLWFKANAPSIAPELRHPFCLKGYIFSNK